MAEQESRPTILVVDDIPDNIHVLAEILRSDYRVKIALDGPRALRTVKASPLDLILLDIMMPGMDGYEVCRRLKADHTTTRIPVIFVKARGQIDGESLGFEVGAADYIIKPVSPSIVTARVKVHLENRAYQEKLEDMVETRTAQLKEQHRRLKLLHSGLQDSFHQMIRIFINLMELHEPFLGSHVKRVAALAITLTKLLDLPEEQVRTIEIAALLHDVGLLGIPPRLMTRKRAMISPEEFALIQQGPILGQDALQPVPRLKRVGEIIRSLHEYYDGNGFPDSLSGSEIPYESRLLAVVNAYDAMRFKRPPDPPLPMNEIVHYLMEMKGKQFDPDLVEGFLKMLREELAEPSDEQHISLEELKPGMVLAHPIQTQSGTLLISRDAILTEVTIDKLRHFHRIQPIEGQIYIRTE